MLQTAYICSTCGVQYEPSEFPPSICPICEDERQYVNPNGQSWTTLERLNQQYRNVFEKVAPHLYAIYTTPHLAIGQRAHLLLSPSGNVLWDCITVLDASTQDLIDSLGGIQAIAISHPHYYSTIIEWSDYFRAPVYIHSGDGQWLGRRSAHIQLWEGASQDLWDGIKIIHTGGHFEGASVLYWPEGKGSLLVGDSIQVSPDLKTVSFMYSYPNLIPLKKSAIINIEQSVKDLEYDALYGAFGKYIKQGAKNCMDFSVNRYLSIYE